MQFFYLRSVGCNHPNPPMADHPPRFDLDDYLPYLINRVGSIMALRFGVTARSDTPTSLASPASKCRPCRGL
jgi:hypothetical protein